MGERTGRLYQIRANFYERVKLSREMTAPASLHSDTVARLMPRCRNSAHEAAGRWLSFLRELRWSLFISLHERTSTV
jgi:hypothetical protein